MRGRGALSPPTVRCGGSSAGTPHRFSKHAARRPCRSSSLIWHSPHINRHTHTPRLQAAVCCSKGHHTPGHIDRCPLLKVCALHGLLPCPRCTLMQRGVRHCYARGHHKVCTPAPTRTRPAAPPKGPHKRQCLRSPGPSHYPLMRSPHISLTPPVTKRRRPRTPPPPLSPTAALPQEVSDDGGMDVAHPLFGQGHGRATQEIT